LIKEYFHHYYMHQSDLTIDLNTNVIMYHNSKAEPWKITIVDTGINTMTGGRIKRIKDYIKNDTFMLTYGDGVGDINIKNLLEFHKKNKRFATLTTIQPTGRFGAIEINNDNTVISFKEKPKGDGAWINAGFFVLEPEIFDYIKNGDSTTWEKEPIEQLVKEGQLMSYKHNGFWKPMDTIRDKIELENLWVSGKALWKLWND
jgi:glucose-1-phosphate cytidylyltransferase